MDYSCLEALIGLSQSECECHESGIPDDAADSLSGYYLDDMEDSVPLHFPKNALDCRDGNLWDMMTRARSEGAVEFVGLLNQAIYQYNELINKTWTGSIGDKKTNSYLTNINPWVGFKIWGNTKIKEQAFVIESISLELLSAGTYDLYILKNEVQIDVVEFVIASAAPVTVTLPSPIVIQAYDQYGDSNEYTFRYQIAANRAKNVKFNCACSGSYTLREWEKHFSKITLDGADADSMDTSAHSGHTYGIRLFGNLICRSDDWICRISTYQDSSVFNVMAKAYQLISINKLLGAIVTTNKINRYTTHDQNHIYGKMSRNAKKIRNDIPWLAMNLPEGLNTCIKCKDTRKMRMVTIEV